MNDSQSLSCSTQDDSVLNKSSIKSLMIRFKLTAGFPNKTGIFETPVGGIIFCNGFQLRNLFFLGGGIKCKNQKHTV